MARFTKDLITLTCFSSKKVLLIKVNQDPLPSLSRLKIPAHLPSQNLFPSFPRALPRCPANNTIQPLALRSRKLRRTRRLLQQNQRSSNNAIQRRRSRPVGNHNQQDPSAVKGRRNDRRVRRGVERHGDVAHAVEEDGVVRFPALVVRGQRFVRVSVLRVDEGDGGARVAGRGGGVVAELRQLL